VATTGRAEQRWRASQGEGNAGRWWEDLSIAATGRAEQRWRAPHGERPGRSRLATSVERLESDGPISPTMNPDAWPTIQTSPENTTRRSRRPGAWGSQEPGARNPEPGARSPEPSARSRETGARSPEPGARSPEPGARNPKPGARRGQRQRWQRRKMGPASFGCWTQIAQVPCGPMSGWGNRNPGAKPRWRIKGQFSL
jgi:hypothetical protein